MPFKSELLRTMKRVRWPYNPELNRFESIDNSGQVIAWISYEAFTNLLEIGFDVSRIINEMAMRQSTNAL
jgi:hypothetical protein